MLKLKLKLINLSYLFQVLYCIVDCNLDKEIEMNEELKAAV